MLSHGFDSRISCQYNFIYLEDNTLENKFRDLYELRFIEDFPFMIHRGELMYCSIGDGWYPLLYELCSELKKVATEVNIPLDNIYVFEVKEKYGVLRFSMSPEIPEFNKIIRKFEDKSKTVCIYCGEPGYLRYESWIEPCCDKCFDRYRSKQSFVDKI